MASSDTHIFYSYWDTNGDGINKDYITSYSKSIIFDSYNRSFYTDGKPFGNHDMGSYHGEIFNDFEHNHAYGDFSSAHGTHVTTYNSGEFGVGKYNNSVKDITVFSVGNGTNTTPSNVFEIHNDDTAYLGGNLYMFNRDIHRHTQTYTTYAFSSTSNLDNFNTIAIVFNDYTVCVDILYNITIRCGLTPAQTDPIWLELSDDEHGVFATSTNSIVPANYSDSFVTFTFKPVMLPKWFRIKFKNGNNEYVFLRCRCVIYKEPNGTGSGITTWGTYEYRQDISPCIGINIAENTVIESVNTNNYDEWEDIVN